MKKALFLTTTILGIIGGIIFYYAPLFYSQPKNNLTSEQKGVVLKEETTGRPKRIIVPKLKINTEVEDVGLDASGRMDVPENSDNVGWYDLGVSPGKIGSAVIGGHLDSKTGPAVFYKLNTLSAGDTITIIDENGKIINFEVTNIKSFFDNQFPINEVFAVNDKPRLNLITCDGIYDKTQQNYNRRVVVFSEMK